MSDDSKSYCQPSDVASYHGSAMSVDITHCPTHAMSRSTRVDAVVSKSMIEVHKIMSGNGLKGDRSSAFGNWDTRYEL